jgi:hypothetical protein
MNIINTTATLVIAIATSATGYFAWRSWRQQQADRKPVIEFRYDWTREGSLIVRVTIRNRSYESIIVERARVARPRGALLTQDRTRDRFGGETGFAHAAAAEIALGQNVAPPGTTFAAVRGIGFAGGAVAETITMNIQFPGGWSGGWLKLALCLATISLRSRREWITISKRIPPPPAQSP